MKLMKYFKLHKLHNFISFFKKQEGKLRISHIQICYQLLQTHPTREKRYQNYH